MCARRVSPATFSRSLMQRKQKPVCKVAYLVRASLGVASHSATCQGYEARTSNLMSGRCRGWKVGKRSRHTLHLNRTMLPKTRCAESICSSMSFLKDVWILAVRTGTSLGEYMTTEVGRSCLEASVLE